MGIFTTDGVWIFGTNTMIANEKILCNENEGEITFESEPLKLLAGEYILQCSVIETNSTPMDYHQEYMHFRVSNPIRESGYVHYDVKWKVDV